MREVKMLTIERTKQLLNNPALSDKEAEAIRDDFRLLAEIIFQQSQTQRKKQSDNSNYGNSGTN